MNGSLVIIGANGHGKVVADIAKKTNKYGKIMFLDDNANITHCLGMPVVGTSERALDYIGSTEFFIAIGNPEIRKKMSEQLLRNGANFATLIHPSSVIGEDVEIGTGTVIMAGTVINSGTVIGKGCIINTCSSIDHDCKMLDYAHIAVGAHIAGTVNIGEKTWIGAGATVSNNVNICGNCMIGAGAVVVKDINEPGTYIGVPAYKKA